MSDKFRVYSPEWFSARDDYVARVAEGGEFARVNGNLGRIYGEQWRKWKTEDGRVVDQLGGLIRSIKGDPNSRRHILSAWNPGELDLAALPPCHVFYQINVQDGFLDLKMYQRYADIFLGVPFNIESYSALASMIAKETGLVPRKFIHTFGSAHLYVSSGSRAEFYRDNLGWLKSRVLEAKKPEDFLEMKEDLSKRLPSEVVGGRVIENSENSFDHVTAMVEQLARVPTSLPRLVMEDKSFFDFTVGDLRLEGYSPQPVIKRAMAA